MAQSVAVEIWSREETVGEDVVSAVAEATDADPLSLEPLYDAVGPETVTALFERGGGDVDRSPDRLEFTYSGCDVVVGADGDVRVSNPDRETETEDRWR